MKELGFFPNWSFQHPRSLELAAKIAEIAPGDLNSTFFVSSGSEAVETVIKLARQYHKANGEPGGTRSSPGTWPTTARRWARSR